MIKVQNIQKHYNKSIVLDIPNLQIQKGEIFGLVGNNGAGKTTLFRLILDLVKTDRGEILSKNLNVRNTFEWKTYTGSFLDESFLIDYLSPEEYFNFIAKTYNISNSVLKNTLEKYNEFFNDEILNKKKYIRDLSKGNQKKVGIIAAILVNPEILILDEPYESLDPSTQIRLSKLIKELNKTQNTTILISSHDLTHITDVCRRVVVLDKGIIKHDLKTNNETLGVLENYFSV